MTDLSVICWKWKPEGATYRSEFTGDHVNTLKRMVERNLSVPHRFICFTDDPEGIDEDIEIVKLWENPVECFGSHKKPNCFYRIKAFSKDFKDLVGDRFLSLDLDTVITGNIDHLVNHGEDFKIWGDTAVGTPYNGSCIYLKTGARSAVHDLFDPEISPGAGRLKNYIGSDQAWIAIALGENEKKFNDEHDGVYSFRNQIRGRCVSLPDNCCIVFFHGAYDPWHDNIQFLYKWVKEHYR